MRASTTLAVRAWPVRRARAARASAAVRHRSAVRAGQQQTFDAQYGATQNGQAQFSAGQHGQAQQHVAPQQPYGFGQQGQSANESPGPLGADPRRGGQPQNGAGQYGTGPQYAVGQQESGAAQGTPPPGGATLGPPQAMPAQQGTSFPGPQPVPGFPPSPSSPGQSAAQSYQGQQAYQAQQAYPGEQHHEQPGAEPPYNAQLSYDDQGYDDQGYAAPGRAEQIPPGLEFSAAFGNREHSFYGEGADADAVALSGQARADGDGYGAPASQPGGPAGHALAGQQGDSAQEESAAAQYSQFGPVPGRPRPAQDAGQAQQHQESGRFPQFAESLAALSAPVPADATAAGSGRPPARSRTSRPADTRPAAPLSRSRLPGPVGLLRQFPAGHQQRGGCWHRRLPDRLDRRPARWHQAPGTATLTSKPATSPTAIPPGANGDASNGYASNGYGHPAGDNAGNGYGSENYGNNGQGHAPNANGANGYAPNAYGNNGYGNATNGNGNGGQRIRRQRRRR